MELHIGEAFSIDPGYLVTERSAVIGQSGSGKSYLVSVICEELAANDLGFVVIDTENTRGYLIIALTSIQSILRAFQRTKSIFNNLSQSQKKSSSMSLKRKKKS
jgi:DNA helicase HerA-like ATPase